MDKTAFSILVANVDTCSSDTVSNWKEGIDHGKNGVTAMEMFDISKDGCCEAKRPGNEKKNKKWKPDCGSTDTPAMHPFKKPTQYQDCMDATEALDSMRRL